MVLAAIQRGARASQGERLRRDAASFAARRAIARACHARHALDFVRVFVMARVKAESTLAR
jgi:hypothetical protein